MQLEQAEEIVSNLTDETFVKEYERLQEVELGSWGPDEERDWHIISQYAVNRLPMLLDKGELVRMGLEETIKYTVEIILTNEEGDGELPSDLDVADLIHNRINSYPTCGISALSVMVTASTGEL